MSAVGPTVAEEMLEVCDEHNQVTGLVKRGVVHKEGLRHRAVNVLLFTPDGKLLLQRRSAAKDVCPNRWDLSVGEHLQVGESYEAAARRGLREELGVEADDLRQLLGPHPNDFEYPDAGVIDREFNELWGVVFGGPIEPDGVEVAETRLASLDAVLQDMQRDPDCYTPWCRSELRLAAGSPALAALLARGPPLA